MRKVRIDCRECGGGGCKRCRHTGTSMVWQKCPTTDARMPNDRNQFESARERCECYEGFRINDEATQCTHVGSLSEWCEPETCPLVMPNVEVTGAETLLAKRPC